MADAHWSARALASLTAQDDYLRALNPAAADSVLSEIERLAALIAEFPQMGRRIDGTSLRYHVTARYRYPPPSRKAFRDCAKEGFTTSTQSTMSMSSVWRDPMPTSSNIIEHAVPPINDQDVGVNAAKKPLTAKRD